ncbi:MAG: ABC transporter ATP-binding protein [Actinomycetota bacterium]
MASVTFESVQVASERTVLLDAVDLHVPDGAVAAVVGPSGSGKSTLLRAVAGLARISGGCLRLGERDVTVARTADRDVAMVFQEPSLLPRRTGRRNVEFPLEIRRATLESIRERVDAEARAMHIEHLLERLPSEMSRGEEQMVQVARALVRVPQVLLLDEPFASLDEPRRRAMRAELALLQAGYGVTTVIATNDPRDAVELATMVVALEGGDGSRPGRVVQVGATDDVRGQPATLDTAASLGDLWTIPVVVRADAGAVWLVGELDASFRVRSWSPATASSDGRRLQLGVRTEHVIPGERGVHDARVRRVIPGSDPRAVLELAGCTVMTAVPLTAPAGSSLRVDLVGQFVFDERGRRIA